MSDKVDFTWSITPPDPIEGARVEAGQTQKLPRDLAKRYATAGYGYIGKLAKPEKLIDFTWGIDPGYSNGEYVKAGQTQRLPLRLAEQYEVGGRGSIGKTLKPGWAHPDPESEMAQRLAREAYEARPDEQKRQVLVNFDKRTRKPVFAQDGWGW